jgi:hypothetical protein
MFLIDDDQTQILKRQEQRRPCADDDLRIALPHHLPQATPLGHGDSRMPLSRSCPKACLDPGQKLRCQRDLRQEHQRLAPHPERLGNGFEIDLGLARTGDTLQQCGAISTTLDRPDKMFHRRGLIHG